MAEMCADCGASFGSAAELVKHMRTAHSGGDASASLAMNPEASNPGFKCARCGAVFATPELLAAHGLQPHSAATGRPDSRPKRQTRPTSRGWATP
jgi:uncharacterized C2H2 Zn-finger protein